MAASIITSVTGDVNYDGFPDTVSLVGVQAANSNAWTQLSVSVQDGASGRFTALPLPEEAAYHPSLNLVSLTGADRRDILVSLPTGGSGGIVNYAIFAFENGGFRQIFSSEAYNARFLYQVDYLDGYTVRALSLQNGLEYFVDLTGKGTRYLEQLYNADGSLREPTEGFVNPLSGLFPVDFDGNGQASLLAYQRVAGLYNADSLGFFLNTLDWQEGAFVLTDQMLAVSGTDPDAAQPRQG